jgi:hypothetical protein
VLHRDAPVIAGTLCAGSPTLFELIRIDVFECILLLLDCVLQVADSLQTQNVNRKGMRSSRLRIQQVNDISAAMFVGRLK